MGTLLLSASSLSIYNRSGGRLFEGDMISLSFGFTITSRRLNDQATGAHHVLDPLAEQALVHIEHSRTVESWIFQMDRLGIKHDGQRQIITFLADVGGLTIRRPFLGSLRKARQDFYGYTVGHGPDSLTRRWPANLKGITASVTQATRGLLWLMLFVALLCYGAGVPGATILYLGGITALVFWSTVILHEYAHTWAFGSARESAMTIQKNFNVGIIHQTLPARREVLSALCGPLVGGIAAVIVCVVSAKVLGQPLLIVSGWLLALFHQVSLLPNYGDGRSLYQNIRQSLRA